MINIVLNMPEVYAMDLAKGLRMAGKFTSKVMPLCPAKTLTDACRELRADVVLMHVSMTPGYTAADREGLLPLLRRGRKPYKLALIADEKAGEEVASFLGKCLESRAADAFFLYSAGVQTLAESLEELLRDSSPLCGERG